MDPRYGKRITRGAKTSATALYVGAANIIGSMTLLAYDHALAAHAHEQPTILEYHQTPAHHTRQGAGIALLIVGGGVALAGSRRLDQVLSDAERYEHAMRRTAHGYSIQFEPDYTLRTNTHA
jgi:hypothetical protein